MKDYFKYTLGIITVLSLFLIGCEDKTEDHEENFVITLEVLQNGMAVDTLVTNVEATFIFAVESVEDDGHGDDDHNEHVPGLDPHIVMEMMNSHNGDHDDHMETSLHESDDEPGHYEGHYTFDEPGTYQIDFGFNHDGTEVEDQFQIICRTNN